MLIHSSFPSSRPVTPREWWPLWEIPQRLQSMLYIHLRFQIQFTEDARLPEYKGALLRGALMWDLRQQECKRPSLESCKECSFLSSCSYAELFEAAKGDHLQSYLQRTNCTLPCILKPPLESKEYYPKGQTITFEQIVMGPYHHYLPKLIQAIVELGRRGFGADKGSGESRFTLLDVQTHTPFGWRTISAAPHRLYPEPCHIWSVGQWPMSVIPAAKLQLDFLTPLRLRVGGRYVKSSELTLLHLIRSISNRLKDLYQNFSNEPFHKRKRGPFPDLYSGLLSLAEDPSIALVSRDLHPKKLRRYSNRQKKTTPLNGLLGSIQWEQVPAPLVWLLQVGQLFHIGKSSIHGCGLYHANVSLMG